MLESINIDDVVVPFCLKEKKFLKLRFHKNIFIQLSDDVYIAQNNQIRQCQCHQEVFQCPNLDNYQKD